MDLDPKPEEIDSLEDDFEKLLRGEDIDINIEDEDGILDEDQHKLENVKKQRVSYLDDFEALLKENSDPTEDICDKDNDCDIDADFDALIEEEQVVVDKGDAKTNNSNDSTEIVDKEEEAVDNCARSVIDTSQESHSEVASCEDTGNMQETVTEEETDGSNECLDTAADGMLDDCKVEEEVHENPAHNLEEIHEKIEPNVDEDMKDSICSADKVQRVILPRIYLGRETCVFLEF